MGHLGEGEASRRYCSGAEDITTPDGASSTGRPNVLWIIQIKSILCWSYYSFYEKISVHLILAIANCSRVILHNNSTAVYHFRILTTFIPAVLSHAPSSGPPLPPPSPLFVISGSQRGSECIGFIRSYATNVIQPGCPGWGRILLEGGFGRLSLSLSLSLSLALSLSRCAFLPLRMNGLKITFHFVVEVEWRE